MSIKSSIVRVLPPWVVERLRRYRLKRHLASFPAYTTERRLGKIQRKIYIADSLAQGWYDRDQDLLREIELLSSGKLQLGATVFDLGAHQGVVGMMLTDAVGANGRVVCVEGTLHNAEIARKNAHINALANMEVLHAVVGENSAVKVSFGSTLNGQVDLDGKSSLVDSVTIDSLAESYGRPDCLYIDVEGFECQALRGAIKTLEHHPDCFVEVHVNHGLEKFGSVKEVLDCFQTRGYRMMTATNEQDFAPLGERTGDLSDRFYLIAMHS